MLLELHLSLLQWHVIVKVAPMRLSESTMRTIPSEGNTSGSHSEQRRYFASGKFDCIVDEVAKKLLEQYWRAFHDRQSAINYQAVVVV